MGEEEEEKVILGKEVVVEYDFWERIRIRINFWGENEKLLNIIFGREWKIVEYNFGGKNKKLNTIYYLHRKTKKCEVNS